VKSYWAWPILAVCLVLLHIGCPPSKAADISRSVFYERLGAKKVYVTLELSRNLAVIGNEVRWVPVATITWGDKQVVASIDQFGAYSGSLDSGGKVRRLSPDQVRRLLEAVEAIKRSIEETEE
jgi:hypothetical protein